MDLAFLNSLARYSAHASRGYLAVGLDDQLLLLGVPARRGADQALGRRPPDRVQPRARVLRRLFVRVGRLPGTPPLARRPPGRPRRRRPHGLRGQSRRRLRRVGESLRRRLRLLARLARHRAGAVQDDQRVSRSSPSFTRTCTRTCSPSPTSSRPSSSRTGGSRPDGPQARRAWLWVLLVALVCGTARAANFWNLPAMALLLVVVGALLDRPAASACPASGRPSPERSSGAGVFVLSLALFYLYSCVLPAREPRARRAPRCSRERSSTSASGASSSRSAPPASGRGLRPRNAEDTEAARRRRHLDPDGRRQRVARRGLPPEEAGDAVPALPALPRRPVRLAEPARGDPRSRRRVRRASSSCSASG